jgi:hypothetical protein
MKNGENSAHFHPMPVHISVLSVSLWCKKDFYALCGEMVFGIFQFLHLLPFLLPFLVAASGCRLAHRN